MKRSTERVTMIQDAIQDQQSNFASLSSPKKPVSYHCINHHQKRLPKLEQKSAVLGADSWLRRFGLYGSFTVVSTSDEIRKTRVCVGYKLPTWVLSKSIMFDIQFSSLGPCETGIRILSGTLRVQNQVLKDSPFMAACQKGDIQLIRQHLNDKSGFLGDRTICSGKTPLLVSKI